MACCSMPMTTPMTGYEKVNYYPTGEFPSPFMMGGTMPGGFREFGLPNIYGGTPYSEPRFYGNMPPSYPSPMGYGYPYSYEGFMGGEFGPYNLPMMAGPRMMNYPSMMNPYEMPTSGFENYPGSYPGYFYGMPPMMPPAPYGYPYPPYYGTETPEQFPGGPKEPWRTRRYSTSSFPKRRYTSAELMQLPARPTSSLEYYTFQNPVRLDSNGNRWLFLVFDLSGFKPEEINVTLYTKDKYIEVHASHDTKATGEHAIRRSYDRKYYFPSDLNPGDVTKLELKSHFTNEGQLFCEALLPPLGPNEMQSAHAHYPIWTAPVKVEKKDM